jgi:formate hydrogenlyase transcriptional activator
VSSVQTSAPIWHATLSDGSSQMRAIGTIIENVANTATVLIRGESGVGKDLVARAIHAGSSRRHRPFVKVNCAAIPSELLESEFFGHEKGSFTGAHQRKPGQFESADKGTIYLDEIGELPLALQAKLLHVLQDFRFSRVGGHGVIAVDSRVIAATNRNLEQAMARREFGRTSTTGSTSWRSGCPRCESGEKRFRCWRCGFSRSSTRSTDDRSSSRPR